MSSSAARAKLLALGLGALCALAALELGLRAAGGVENLRRRGGSGGPARGRMTILCYGNSHTLGMGAPPGESYCDHLRGRLAREYPEAERLFRVMNRGVGNSNSTQVLERIRADFDRLRPDLALIMTGEPNTWNRRGYGRFLAREGRRRGAVMSPAASRLYDLAYHLAVFRFGTMLYHRLRDRLAARLRPRSRFFPETPLTDRLTLSLKWFAVLNDERSACYGKLTDEEFAEAVAALEDLGSRPEGRLRAVYELLGELALSRGRDARAAARWFRESLAVDPGTFNLGVYRALRGSASADPELAEVLALARKTYPGDAAYAELERLASSPPLAAARAADPAGSLRSLTRALRVSPEYDPLLMGVAGLYRRLGRREDLLRLARQTLRRNPFGHHDMLAVAGEMAREPADSPLRELAQETLQEFRERFPRDGDMLLQGGVDDASLAAWIESDIDEMAAFLTARGARFVLQTYPPKPDRSVRLADEIILRLARARGYPVADTRGYFESLFAGRADRESYYAVPRPDEHLNGKGYRALADFLFESLRRGGLLPAPSRPSRHSS